MLKGENMSTRRIVTMLALGLWGLSACSGPMKLTRLTQAPTIKAEKTKIKKVVDLGAQNLPASGEFKVKDSDGRLSPGEWVAVCGKGLGPQSIISLGAEKIKPAGYLETGLLFKMPRGIDPRQVSKLQVENENGKAEKKVKLYSYIAAADRRGNKLRFMTLGPKGLKGKVKSKKYKTLGPQAFSTDGAKLYVLGRGDGKDDAKSWAKSILKSAIKPPKRVDLPVGVFAMGAKKGPKKQSEFSVGLDSQPTNMASPAEGQILILSEGHLLWLELNEAQQPKERGRLDLRGENRTCYAGLKALASDKLALLDPCTNSLQLVTMDSKGLQALGTPMDLAPGTDLPLSLGMEAEPGDPSTLWVLQGPNFLIPKEEMNRGLAKLKTGTMNILAPLTGKHVATDDSPRRSLVISRLLKLQVTEAGPEVKAELPLPEKFFPMALAPLGEGRVAIAGVNGKVFDFAGIKANLKGLKKIIKMLLNTVQLGRVVVLAEGAEPEEKLKGLALYFQTAPLSGDMLVSVLRPVAQKFPPSVDVQWGIELGNKFVGFKSLDYKSLLPPYVFSPILFQ